MNGEPNTTTTGRDGVTVGSGVDGLSATVYAAQTDFEPLVLEGRSQAVS